MLEAGQERLLLISTSPKFLPEDDHLVQSHNGHLQKLSGPPKVRDIERKHTNAGVLQLVPSEHVVLLAHLMAHVKGSGVWRR